jgi:tRNA dimethylallyltransferase
MTSADRPSVIAVVGATATGKSTVAELLATELDGEIVSADSMQVYRGMDIGTAKVPPEQRHVPYHCVDLVDPGEQYSAAIYQGDARAAISQILQRGRVPIVCGGTGLYVRAALDDYRFPPGEQRDNPVRERYKRLLEEHDARWLHEQLRLRDPASAEVIEPNNTRRVIRAFEMLEEGTSYAEQHAHQPHIEPCFPTLYAGLRMERPRLYARIDERVDRMLAAGLTDEIRHLVDAGFEEGITSLQAIGYKEFLPLLHAGLLDDEQALDEAAQTVKRSTRRYAKRQDTWFRKDRRIHWFDVDTVSPQDVATGILTLWRSQSETNAS